MNSKNTRKTLIGTFIGMMALTAASAATAGVAWFTTTRTANVSFHSASVTSNRGDLLVGELGAAPTLKAYAADEADPAFDSSMDAISSYDGVNFYNALLDVDGSELGIYLKDKDPNVAEFGFSAGTQANAETDLTVYLEKMDIKVTDDYAEETFDGTGAAVEFTLTDEASKIYEVKVGDKVMEAKENEQDQEFDYVFDGTDKITFEEAPVAGSDNISVAYQKAEEEEVAADNSILNSVRVALFASNEEDAIADIAVEENQTLVWDTTHANSEVHNGITVTAEGATHEDEEHYIRKDSEKFIDLDYAPENISAISAATLTRGNAQPVDIKSMLTVAAEGSRRLNINYEVKRGDLITVTYTADTIGKKTLANVASKIDGYYAGKDLVDEYGGQPETDGDLTLYGAYLGETKGSDALNVVVRAWIEGTDADHSEEGSGWHPTDEHSINVENHNYKVAFDLGLAAIDVNVA